MKRLQVICTLDLDEFVFTSAYNDTTVEHGAENVQLVAIKA
jgi:hypothetical protein